MLLVRLRLGETRPYRSVRPRTLDCQSSNMGSNPIGAAIQLQILFQRRVVQSGRMHALGACGCKFKSCHADQKKNIEKNLTFLSDAGTIVVKDKRLSNSCFRKWFPFGNVLVPATV